FPPQANSPSAVPPMKFAPPLWLIRLLLLPPAIFGGVYGGNIVFQAAIYALARLTDRDVAELKDMLIWSFIIGSIVGAIAAVSLVLWLTRTGKLAQKISLIALLISMTGGISMMTAAFDWPKSSGTPIIRYELRLPAGTSLPERDAIDLTVW